MIGFLFIMLDPRYYGQLDYLSLWDVVTGISLWVYLAYFLLTEYLLFSLVNSVRINNCKLVVVFIMLLIQLIVPYVYIAEWILIHSEFATTGGEAFPMTIFTHVGSIIFIVVIPFNLIYLLYLRNKKSNEKI